MSFDRQSGIIIFECDGCGETIDAETSDWISALATIKEEGWKVVKARHGFNHYCGDCSPPENPA